MKKYIETADFGGTAPKIFLVAAAFAVAFFFIAALCSGDFYAAAQCAAIVGGIIFVAANVANALGAAYAVATRDY